YTYTPYPDLANQGKSDVFTYQVMQNDGDQDTALLTINVGATVATAPTVILGNSVDNSLNGTAQDNVLLGYEGNDTINGNGGNDRIEGGAGNDTLSGNDGNDVLLGGLGADILDGGIGDDILIGGLGSDTMTGGTGKDSFKWGAGDGDGGIDRITDVSTGTSGDILDISALLDVPSGATASTLAAYLNFSYDGDNNRTVLIIDGNGATGGSQVTQTVYFDGVDLTGGSSDQQAIINSLLINLKLDD
ncbi:MAG: type I secretion C-terminal target domain-containing protein, partial [Aeromonas sp.]